MRTVGRRNGFQVGVLLLFIGLVCGGLLYGQLSTASITGTIRDSTGAVAPGAQLVLTNKATSIERRVESNSAGN